VCDFELLLVTADARSWESCEMAAEKSKAMTTAMTTTPEKTEYRQI
jgi:hypothetical protein